MRWFSVPVVEIKQISAYSCRSMNGQRGAHISEHAFGNALDVAAFVFADGRIVKVKEGWRGLPEEQGFLRDVQGAACEQFTTVLAPGADAFHYDHIHVDLMRRASGRRICQPGAVDGETVASRARQRNPRQRGPGQPSSSPVIAALRRCRPLRRSIRATTLTLGAARQCRETMRWSPARSARLRRSPITIGSRTTAQGRR